MFDLVYVLPGLIYLMLDLVYVLLGLIYVMLDLVYLKQFDLNFV